MNNSKVKSSRQRAGRQKLKLPFKREFSAGGVVFKKFQISNDKLQIKWLIGKHSGYHKWVLPKGLIEKGERGIETAIREVEEEMGIRAAVVGKKPIHKEEYWFVAEYKKQAASSKKQGIRRVAVYQESPEFSKSKKKMRVFKIVSFYLMEYVSGDSKDHDWEMSEAGWFTYNEALKRLAFKGERDVLVKANDIIRDKG